MSKLETLFPLTFSSSILEDVWACDTYFYRKYCQKMMNKTSNGDLVAGSLFAIGCEMIRKGYHEEHLDEDEG